MQWIHQRLRISAEKVGTLLDIKSCDALHHRGSWRSCRKASLYASLSFRNVPRCSSMSNFMSTLQTVTGTTLLAAQDAYRTAPLLPILGGDYKLPSFFSSLPNVTLTNKRNFNRLTNIIQYMIRYAGVFIISTAYLVKWNRIQIEQKRSRISNGFVLCACVYRLLTLV